MKDIKVPLYTKIATIADARTRCDNNGNSEWEQKHEAELRKIEKSYLPQGSGFDNEVFIDREQSGLDKLVFGCYYHHMNESGYYDGYTHHKIICTPTFVGPDIKVTGENKNNIKEYIADVFYDVLGRMA